MQNPSELCVRCGLCCVVLRATCSIEEATTLCEAADVPLERFADTKEDPVVMKFPCVFLRGRPGRWVRCVAYDKPRPEVCKVYLCRTATQYKLGEVGLDEAIRTITSAFWNNNPGAFNWCGTDQDKSVVVREWIEEERQRLIAKGIEGPLQDYNIAARLTPAYVFKSLIDSDMFNMHMWGHDKRMSRLKGSLDVDELRSGLELYLDSDLLGRLGEADLRVAGLTMCAVLTELRDMFQIQEG